ncbi:hypothetical protein GDI3916 (plasmid) [Gluconacetobacter diazotrophicus PA1 5]|uniref:Uncharacterized protein n=1 Tax=Gluconacetobacter diazotrophicus (strain ATCC 49037 / DSM 5601 / CCUG 37298 / CIP 103539 / LMG 7603 / PAl5) TaxID=272568 RepID=A9HT96_GLUDA|nr:hypothetical protein GDI3916 [Gluconacetobacter diazotrophicus PA1 5]
MRFSPWPYGVAVTDLSVLMPPQPVEVGPSEPLGLFPDMKEQPRPKALQWTPEQRYLRDRQARAWRAIRREIQTMPDAERSAFLDAWRMLRNPIYPASPCGLKGYLAAYRREASGNAV